MYIQRSAKRLVRGCEKFVPALVYLFCLALPGSCLARFAYFLADLCKILMVHTGLQNMNSDIQSLWRYKSKFLNIMHSQNRVSFSSCQCNQESITGIGQKVCKSC